MVNSYKAKWQRRYEVRPFSASNLTKFYEPASEFSDKLPILIRQNFTCVRMGSGLILFDKSPIYQYYLKSTADVPLNLLAKFQIGEYEKINKCICFFPSYYRTFSKVSNKFQARFQM